MKIGVRSSQLVLFVLALTALTCDEAIAQLSVSDRPPRSQRFPRQVGVPMLEFSGPEEGYPSRPEGITNVRRVTSQPIKGALTAILVERIRQAALQNTQVREALGERFAYIRTDEVEQDKNQQTEGPLHTRVTFFSHSKNVAAEVGMVDLTVESVITREGLVPSEGVEEIESPIAMARNDSRLKDKVQGLTGDAIVADFNPPGLTIRHRILRVMFARKGLKSLVFLQWLI